MNNMLRFQFRRLYKKVSLYIMLALVLITTLSTLGSMYGDRLNIYSVRSFLPYLFTGSGYKGGNNYYSMENSTIICFLSLDSFLLLLIGIFVATFVTEDRVKGTIKNIYSKGYSREEIFLSKYLAAISVPAVFYFLILIVSYVYLSLRGTGTETYEIFNTKGNVFCFFLFIFLRYIAVSTFYFMLGELSPSTGGAIAFNIFAPYIIFLLIVNLIYSILDAGGAVNYIFQHIIIDFITVTTSSFISIVTLSEEYNITELIITSIVLTLLFGGLSLLITVKKQVKN